VEDRNWDTVFTDIIALYSTTVTYLASKAMEFGEKRKIRAITPFISFKIIEVGTYRKHVCDFLLVIIELFSLDVTAEALRAKIDGKSAISLQRGQFDPKFQVEGTSPTNHFCTAS